MVILFQKLITPKCELRAAWDEKQKKISTVPTTLWRASLHHLIFEAETKAGKIFDIILMILIALSLATVMMDSIAAVRIEYVSFYIISSGFLRLFLQLSMFCVLLLRFDHGATYWVFLALSIFWLSSQVWLVFYSQDSNTCWSFESSESFEFYVFSSFLTTYANGQCC